MITLINALLSLRPGAQWSVDGETYEGIVWHDSVQTQPTQEEISTEILRLEEQRINTEYQRKRQAEYPPFADYLDGLVKGNQSQIDAYIAACLAVKAKYPKTP
jgi:hypothetical protein